MKQIVEETKANGKKQYRVLTDRCFFGLFHCKWKTDKKTESCMEHTWKEDAIFNTLKEAQEHVYGSEIVNGENVVSRKIIDYGKEQRKRTLVQTYPQIDRERPKRVGKTRN